MNSQSSFLKSFWLVHPLFLSKALKRSCESYGTFTLDVNSVLNENLGGLGGTQR
jgi:hypothetical protein